MVEAGFAGFLTYVRDARVPASALTDDVARVITDYEGIVGRALSRAQQIDDLATQRAATDAFGQIRANLSEGRRLLYLSAQPSYGPALLEQARGMTQEAVARFETQRELAREALGMSDPIERATRWLTRCREMADARVFKPRLSLATVSRGLAAASLVIVGGFLLWQTYEAVTA